MDAEAPEAMLVTTCRMCKGEQLFEFLDLGSTPPADRFLRPDQLLEEERHYPLRVVMCENCGLAQLNYVVPPEILYCEEYPYESSMTRAGRMHWGEFAATTATMLGLGPDDLVVDIGSNVGVLLEMFRNQGPRVLGVDPAANIAEIANHRGIETMAAFFGSAVAGRILADKGPAAVITATNVFAHIHDLDDIMLAVDRLLTPDGVFVVEAPYFINLVQSLEYDTIYHEHLSYLSVKPLVRFFARFGMEIFEIQQRDIHGGSFRVFVRRTGQSRRGGPDTGVVEEFLALEERARIYSRDRLLAFAHDVETNRRELLWLLHRLKNQGKRIIGVSAPAKGMTLLNYGRIGPEILSFVTEKSTLKIGRFTPGTHIPVVSDDRIIEEKPDYALLLAWNFAEEIMGNLSAFSRAGGKFIIPIPNPQIVG